MIFRIGDRLPDGTILAGTSPDSGKPMYVTPADAPSTYTFKQAPKYAEQLNRQKTNGHGDWRVPTSGELNVLFQNRDVIGGFNETGSRPAGWYWSSSQKKPGSHARGQRFSDGHQSNNSTFLDSSLRCVRG